MGWPYQQKPPLGWPLDYDSGLVPEAGCWLMNEGSGNKVFDLSGNRKTGSLVADTHFVPGKFGPALSFDGDDSVDCGNMGITSYPLTILAWGKADAITAGHCLAGFVDASAENQQLRIDFIHGIPDRARIFWYSGSPVDIYSQSTLSTGIWYQLVGVFVSDTEKHLYLNGVLEKTETTSYTIPTGLNKLGIGRALDNTPSGGFNGIIDHVMIYNRILSSSEIALLYREPFCMFARAGRSELIGGQIVNLAGTSAALSSLSATAKAMRKVGGNVAGISDVEALLNSIRGRLETERNWLREALFNGMTANAFKLGTTLSLGWFWVRIAGCSVLYRGSGMEEIDFVNILAVAEQDAYETSPPSYIPHNSGSTYFYVVRRFNNCGYQECTLAASVKVSIESNGELAEPQPNKVFDSGAELVDGNKIQLVWFYCPLAQKSQPVCFNVYYDNRTGQINYQNPLATIGYKGRKFYSFQSSTLEAGKYLFAIRPEDASDIENSSLAQLRIQLDTTGPEAVDILRAEAV